MPIFSLFIKRKLSQKSLMGFTRSIRTKNSPRLRLNVEVFLLTDGEVSNTQEVIDLVKEHKDKNRIFSFGIGEGVSSELVDGVTQFGGASRILKSGEEQDELNKHVLRALKPSQSSYYFDPDVGLEMSNENVTSEIFMNVFKIKI